MRTQFEVVVVGGGPAGAVAAATLARLGRAVLLLNGGRRAGAFAGGESLPPLAKALRHELGLEAVLAQGPHRPCYGNAAAWGHAEARDFSFIRSPYGPGWHLDRPSFDAALRTQARMAGAGELAGCLRALQATPAGGWQLDVQLASGEVRPTTAQWVLDCSGRGRVVSRLLGVAYQYADRLVARYVRYRPTPGSSRPAEQLTLVEAAPWGWGHSAVLPGGERIVTLFADAGAPGAWQLGTAAGFAAAVAQLPHLARRLPGHQPLAAPRATDARSGCLAQLGGAGWLAAGDAATAFDPLAAQGILAALWAGHRAALALAGTLAGDATALPAYCEQLRAHYGHLRAQARQHYGQERRWPGEAFWQARQVAPALATSSRILAMS